MDAPSLARVLLTPLAFAALLAFVVWLARFKGIPLPFAPPRLPIVIGWVALFVAVGYGLEHLGSALGGSSAAGRWDELTPSRMVRAATIVFLAPLAEEVAFRGTMYGNLVKKRLPTAAVIILPAVAFAAIHFQYFGPGLAIVFIDGIVYGLARHHTRSLFVPVLLHMLGNAYAVAERIVG